MIDLLSQAGIPPSFLPALQIDVARLAEALGPGHLEHVRALLQENPARAAELARLLVCSRFALREFERHPELLPDLLGSGDLARGYAEGAGEMLRQRRLAAVQSEALFETDSLAADEQPEPEDPSTLALRGAVG
ncbi:MAG: hypothetical protein ACKO4A_11480, partial [Gammaproteobacteria bacterium]